MEKRLFLRVVGDCGVCYDITSTYFEGQADSKGKAARGDSRDSRPDCEQVCIGFVVTPEQLPLALWMEGRGLGNVPQKLLEELRQIHSFDVVLTVDKQNAFDYCCLPRLLHRRRHP